MDQFELSLDSRIKDSLRLDNCGSVHICHPSSPSQGSLPMDQPRLVKAPRPGSTLP